MVGRIIKTTHPEIRFLVDDQKQIFALLKNDEYNDMSEIFMNEYWHDMYHRYEKLVQEGEV